jgi:hypothetical protein
LNNSTITEAPSRESLRVYAVAKTNLDLQALLASAESFGGPGNYRADAQFRSFSLVPGEWSSGCRTHDADDFGTL